MERPEGIRFIDLLRAIAPRLSRGDQLEEIKDRLNDLPVSDDAVVSIWHDKNETREEFSTHRGPIV